MSWDFYAQLKQRPKAKIYLLSPFPSFISTNAMFVLSIIRLA